MATPWFTESLHDDQHLCQVHSLVRAKQRGAQALHTPGRIITRQGVWATHGPNAPKRRYLGTISAKLLMYLDENLPSERLNALHLDASACKEEHKHYICQVESLHTPGQIITSPGQIITYARVCGQPRAKCSQEEVS